LIPCPVRTAVSVDAMLRGIVGVEWTITRVEGKR
jgi:hypothetical protein